MSKVTKKELMDHFQKYAPNQKQYDFFDSVVKEFVATTPFEEALKNPALTSNKSFEFILEKMFSSDDPELKVGFGRVLMHLGYMQMVKNRAEYFCTGKEGVRL